MLLGYDLDFLEERQGLNTIQEIAQQPELWQETIEIVQKADNIIQEIHSNFIDRPDRNNARNDVRIILTGAGSSAFAGSAIAPFLTQKTKRLIEPIATTDIVNAPEDYLIKDKPTVLISFARSGNSPESVAAVKLGKQIVKEFKSIVITCNKDGQLAHISEEDENDLILLMPDKSNDKGFAMTSSLTCMMVACILILLKNNPEAKTWLMNASNKADLLLNQYADMAQTIALNEYKRLIFLGSASQKGIACESALKCLELTAGLIPSVYDSPMGFRHGPKSLVDETSMILFFLSNHSYSRQYDLDMLREISTDKIAQTIVTISSSPDTDAKRMSDYFICTDTDDLPDAISGLVSLLFTQMVAVALSFRLGISPDNPSPSGMVNRVVQGVEIYPY